MPSSSNVRIRILGDARNATQAFDQARSAALLTSKAIGGAFASAGAAFALIEGSVVKVGAEFERYQTQLETITGSSDQASASMDWITKFATTTPYELGQVTDAFIQLKAYGIDPVANDALRTLGNAASAMGKPLSQAVEALADAATGEYERLKEFGIKAKVVGDQVQFHYAQNGQQMTATADKNSAAMIQSTLRGIWNEKYAGGMNKLSQTWDGMTSNLGDSWMIFQKNIANSGAFDAAKNSLAIILDELHKNSGATRGLAADISDVLVVSMEAGVTAAAMLAKGFNYLAMPIDVIRLAIDAGSLVVFEFVDGFYAADEAVRKFSISLLGSSDAQDKYMTNLAANRESLQQTIDGIKATGAESLDALVGSDTDISAKNKKIDDMAVKFMAAMEKARSMPKKKSVALDVSTVSTASTKLKPKGNSADATVAKAMQDAKKIIDIHSAKFAKIQAMGAVAFSSEQAKLQATLQLKLDALSQEQANVKAAALLQGGDVSSIDAYYDEQRINAAQAVADKLGAIEQSKTDKALAIKQQEIDARNALIATGEQAATDLKGQFQQLVSDNQQVHLATLSSNIVSYTDALWQTNKQSGERELAWSKFKGTQKLQFAASSLGALSGLMKSHSRKQFEVGKAAAQGENAINTYMGATKAYASMAGIPIVGPVLGAIAAAAVVAAGVANAQKINSSKMGGSTGGVAVPTMSAGGGGSTPTVGMNAQTGLPQNAPKQAPQATLNVTINAPAGLTDPAVARQLADQLAPHINKSFTNGRQLTQVMV